MSMIFNDLEVSTEALAEVEAVANELEALLPTLLPLLDRAIAICNQIENVERTPWTDKQLEHFWQVTSLQRVHDAYYTIHAATQNAIG